VAVPTGAVRAPVLPRGNFDAISPPHGARVSQASTRSPDPRRPGGACFQANFKDLQETVLWFRMLVDEKEVTVDMSWVLAPSAPGVLPEGGRGCYAPSLGFAVGKHRVTVVIQNPNSASEPTRQILEWEFEVTQ
jgi:hypothetical protein